MATRNLTRRDFLKMAAVTAAGASLAACAPGAVTPAATSNQPAGQITPTGAPLAKGAVTIKLATLDGELSNGVTAQQKPFEDATGTTIELMKIPGSDMRAKITTDLASGSGVYEVILMPWTWVHEWEVGGNIISLDSYITADPKVNVADFIQSIYKMYGFWEGKQYAFPYKPDTQLLFYRKDIFEDPKYQGAFKSKTGKDLKVPEIYEDYVEIAKFFAKKFNSDSPVDFGWSGMGDKGSGWWWWVMRMSDLGGSWFDANMHPNFNNEAGLKALNDYLNMPQFASPDFLQYEWTKSNTAFLSSKVLMMEQWPGLATMAETPEGSWGKSDVVGKVGYGVPPGYNVNGKVVKGSVLGGWCIGISKYSKQPENCYKTIAWLTGPDGEPLKVAGGNAPCRSSTYKNWKATPDTAYFPALLDCNNMSKINSDVDAPPISAQLQDYLTTQINRTLLGDLKPDVALKMIDDEWTKQLKTAGLYK